MFRWAPRFRLGSNDAFTSVATVGFAPAVFGEILDLIDQLAGATAKAALLLLVDRLIAESGAVERRLAIKFPWT